MFTRALSLPDAGVESFSPWGPRQTGKTTLLLIEYRGLSFALCGSSARKVRRGAANLLGGRAFRYELHGLTSVELADDFDLDRLLNHGYLPRIYLAAEPRRMLDAYVGDSLKEEVASEALIRDLPVFSDFLDVAALSHGELVNFSRTSRPIT